MKKLLQSKMVALVALLVIVLSIILTFRASAPWWSYIDEFCIFMAAFTHLMALTAGQPGSPAAYKLNNISVGFGLLFLLSLVGEYIAFACMY